MTNGWVDIKNTDMMLIMGGNPAENHPCGFKWPIEAKLHRNAKMIVVDPRFTRTAARDDLSLHIHAYPNTASLGGLSQNAIRQGAVGERGNLKEEVVASGRPREAWIDHDHLGVAVEFGFN